MQDGIDGAVEQIAVVADQQDRAAIAVGALRHAKLGRDANVRNVGALGRQSSSDGSFVAAESPDTVPVHQVELLDPLAGPDFASV